jgi:acetylornithine deacetylase
VSASLLGDALRILHRLVAYDTRNPPRNPDRVLALFAYTRTLFEGAGFVVDDTDLGDGCVLQHARRGTPTLLVNIHIDTVPSEAGWTEDPHTMWIDEARQRAIGLGTCDIKGALACLLAAVQETKGPLEVLLSSDEEAGSSRCIKHFVSTRDVVNQAVMVCEPTQNGAVLMHRGIGTATGVFRGHAGHASQERAYSDSAVHRAVWWSAKALERVEEVAQQVRDDDDGTLLAGWRFNLGRIEGGTKPNMIASECTVRFGVRPPPGRTATDVVNELCGLVDAASYLVTWTPGYTAPALPAEFAGRNSKDAHSTGVALVRSLGLKLGAPVDFFTEAALFSEAGAIAFVYGPGNIAHAHQVNEFVPFDELTRACEDFTRITGGPS